MNIPILNRANVPVPPAGEVFLFLDADNNNVLSYKDENCNFFLYSQGSNLIIANAGVDNCLCDIVEALTCQFGKSVAKGVLSMDDFNSWWGNINIFRNFTVDPNTGSFTDSITTKPTLLVTVVTTNVLCNGDSTGTAMVSVSGGSAPYVINWGASNPAALDAGSHTVTVTDANNLVVVRTVIITEPAVLALTTVTTPDTGGGVGTATANPTGGTAPYTYEWRDNLNIPIGQTTRTATGLSAGTYMVVLTDVNACSINSLPVIVA